MTDPLRYDTLSVEERVGSESAEGSMLRATRLLRLLRQSGKPLRTGANAQRRGLSTPGRGREEGGADEEEAGGKKGESEKQAEAIARARWATSWMMPWERAQMDVPSRPLTLWERAYWRLFVVLGTVGFVYETWVVGNRRVWRDDQHMYNGLAVSSSRDAPKETWCRARDFNSSRLLSDDASDELCSSGGLHHQGVETDPRAQSWTP